MSTRHLPDSEVIEIDDGFRVRVLSLEMVIRLKEEAGRPKDLGVLPVLRATLEELEQGS